MDSMEAENVASFISVTGVTAETAQQYLNLADNNLEEAVGLFYSAGGPELNAQPIIRDPPSSTAHPSSTHTSATRRGFQQGEVISLDSDDENDDDDDDDAPTVIHTTTPRRRDMSQTNHDGVDAEDDEAMARRLQEEMYSGRESRVAQDMDGYRAPIARTRETLVGPGSYDLTNGDDLEEAVLEQLRRRQTRPERMTRPGIFNQQPVSNSIWNDTDNEADPESRRSALARATAGASETSSKSSMLAEMYRPPFEIMSPLSWDDARSHGREAEKWLLVNIQDPAIFDCQVLNRDLWKNPGVQETLRENFLFMQYAKSDPRGAQYIQYYFPLRDSDSAYPHIAIIDPRTGEQVKMWSGTPAPRPSDFLIQLHEFLDRYSLNVTAKNPVTRRKPDAPKAKPVEAMTEAEMLEMALQQSLGESSTGLVPAVDDGDHLSRSIGDIANGTRATLATTDTEMTDADGSPVLNTTSISPASSPFALISSTSLHIEPAVNMPGTTRIQFRHSNGRVVRRFALQDPVRRVYEWLKAEPLTGRDGVPFELISMGRNLMETVEGSVEAAGLKNGTVMIEFVERD